jgi:hypothetical protein
MTHTLNYLNNVSVGSTSLVIAILVAVPRHQSGKFIFRRTLIQVDDTSVDVIGQSQRQGLPLSLSSE